MKRIEQIQTQINELQKELEILKNPHKRWRAKKEGRYCYLISSGEIGNDIECGYGNDNLRYNFGNYFKTQEEAEQARDRQLAVVRVNDRINELNQGWIPSNRYTNYYIYYYEKYYVSDHCILQKDKMLKYIKTEDKAEQIISEMKDDLDLIFNIK